MTISTATRILIRTLMLLRIERIQFHEQMALLGYREEKGALVQKRGRIRKRPMIDSHFGDGQPASI